MTVLNYVFKECLMEIVFYMYVGDKHNAEKAINYLIEYLDKSTIVENEEGYNVVLEEIEDIED